MTSRSSWKRLLAKSELPDLVKGLNSVITILTIGQETKYANKLCLWARRVYEHVMCSGLSVGSRMRASKEYFTFCRCKAISGRFGDWGERPQFPFRAKESTAEKRRILHQVSRTSRALREADIEVVNESLKTHVELATQRFETPKELRESFASFCGARFGGAMEGILGPVGPSSSFLARKSQDGAPGEIRDITNNFRRKEVSLIELDGLVRSVGSLIGTEFKIVNTDYIRSLDNEGRCSGSGFLWKGRVEALLFPYDKSYECDLIDWDDQRDILFSLMGCWHAIDMNQLPKCRQVAVVERGWKVRVATPLEAPFRYLLGVINSSLLDSLERVPEVVNSLHGRPAEKLDWSNGRRTNLVFSADLKSATDYFPQDLMIDAAKELSEGWPSLWADLFVRAVGPHKLYSPGRDECVTTSRGILMGSPVSWPLLSMYSAWLHSESKSDGWFAVCGDDYIGCHTYGTYHRYKRYRTMTGAVGSPGKDILGTQSVGVFAEELVAVGRCRWIPTVSVRAVLADPKSGKPSWSQGPEVSASLDVLKWTSIQKGRVCGILHKDTYRRLRQARIEPTGPRWLGCAGFPGIPSQTVLLRGRRMVSQSKECVIKWVTDLEMAWSEVAASPSLRARVQQDFYEAGEYLLYCPTDVVGGFGPLRDVVSSRIGQLSWIYYLSGVTKVRSKKLSLGQLHFAISKVCREIEFRGRWVPPTEKIVRGEGICQRLQELEPFCRPIPFRQFRIKVVLRAKSRDIGPLSKRPPTGPGSPSWGAPRKRARLT
jgi:hypothetical protein